MSESRAEQFAEFYEAVHGYPPFPWQNRVAGKVCGGKWPRAIALPTAAGKTATIDIAVFALACGAEHAARRIFFVVDRRIVVDQAYRHAINLSNKLKVAKTGILKSVADALRNLTMEDKPKEGEEDKRRPLDVYALRGGMYRESAWTRSPLQPTLIASTVDQVGSRLLFRGYGVSDSMKPIHAGLVGNDSLILLDEAHCAKPFDQTMQAVRNYRSWGTALAQSFEVVTMTATPIGDFKPEEIECAEDDDREHPVLGARLRAKKPAKLVVADKAKGKKYRPEMVKLLKAHAEKLAATADGCVGIIVNRVATARELAKALGEEAVLLTGRMRPLDRDRIFETRLQSILSTPVPNSPPPPKYVVGTQCLECGADFDFAGLVTECASLDALRQRFGRLNRIAGRKRARAVIVIGGDQAAVDYDDPVYGTSLAKTWAWLTSKATSLQATATSGEGSLFPGVGDVEAIPTEGDYVDFGITAMGALLEGMSVKELNAPSEDAPILFPAHLDCWVQTNPIPVPDPDPALFLHGPKRPGQPDVQVVFRGDLGDKSERWAEIVSLCPPSSSEAVSVPIGVFRKWLAREPFDDESSDVEGEALEEVGKAKPTDETPRESLCWQGPEKSEMVSVAGAVRPNRIYIVPCGETEVERLGDFPELPPTDQSREAFVRSRDKGFLRLADLNVPDDEEGWDDILRARIEAEPNEQSLEWLAETIRVLKAKTNRVVEKHPLGGCVVVGKRRLGQFDPTYLDDSEASESYRGNRAVSLEEHSRGVAKYARRFAEGCGLPTELYEQAGFWHDLGKLDPRFQAMLRLSSPRMAVGEPLAKSARMPRTKEEREWVREVSGYPKGGRHELLSMELVAGRTSCDLLLHLIATHHGSGRPFADAVKEDGSAESPFRKSLFGHEFEAGSNAQTVAAWNAVLPERFWRMVREYGWWGSAYREAVFRLADHAQSREEQETNERDKRKRGEGDANLPAVEVRLSPKVAVAERFELALPGLDGANPLAFLAALGTLVVCDRMFGGDAAMSWKNNGGHWFPVLQLPEACSPDDLVKRLHDSQRKSRQATRFATDMKIPHEEFRVFQQDAARESATDREFSDFLSGYADALIRVKAGPNEGKTKPTGFYFIAGQQKFLKIVRDLLVATTETSLARSLFSEWDYRDPIAGLSFRWNPSDDARYASCWQNPSSDPNRQKKGSMHGANCLAFEALSKLSCFASGTSLETRGIHSRKRQTFFSWALWTSARKLDSVVSLISLGELTEVVASSSIMASLGIAACYRSEKIENQDYYNFATSELL